MKFTRANRSLIAWTLYFSVLFNLFACGIGHGQMMGLQLNGIGGAFCSAMGTPGPTLKTDYSDASIAGWDSLQTCPVCAAAVVCLALSLVIGWLLAFTRTRRYHRELRSKAPPRYCWPSANPRASPLLA
ncbi:DUF2946 domain-containing protein [Pseudomonas sp. 8209]|uniref:DUF2946 domain-containing protein n=1 Tax=Pseudomonas sp. 8209 TaxID=2967214 RepID=UPI0023640B52|nr:DUF2946 domain-containing protein [Pseudomonas sp. 8209]MDD1957799.1 DUF2946 domain-containing protein [Pseudomonas sp. 8209]